MTMQLLSMRDINMAEIKACDLFICAITTDPRGQSIASSVGTGARERWGVQQAAPEPSNTFPAPYGTTPVAIEQLTNALTQCLVGFGDVVPNVVVDVSCMSRPAMAAAFEALCKAASTRKLRLTVGYVIAAYTPPPESLPPNEDIKPINDWFAGWPSDATASTSLVVGLGYERDKAEGACEYFDAGETWVMVPRSPIGEYDTAVVTNNQELLRRADRRDRALNYRVNCPTAAFGQLASTVSNILPRMNPVLLPFGPKIFFAISLLVAAVYREAGVWHVTGDADLPDTAHAASEHTVGFQVELGPRDEAP